MIHLPIEPDLYLRTASMADAPAIFALTQQNREHLRVFLPWADHVHQLEDTQAFCKGFNHESIYDFFVMAICYKEAVVGLIDFHGGKAKAHKVEIGYWLSRHVNGKGLMTKANIALINYAYTHTNVNRIEIHCDTENTGSQAIAERLGFVREGIARQCVYEHGQYKNLIANSMLREEWKLQDWVINSDRNLAKEKLL